MDQTQELKKINEHRIALCFEGGICHQGSFFDPELGEEVTVDFWNPQEKKEAWEYLMLCSSDFSLLIHHQEELELSQSLLNDFHLLPGGIKAKTPLALGFLLKNWTGSFHACILSTVRLSLQILGQVNDSMIQDNFGSKKAFGEIKNKKVREAFEALQALLKTEFVHADVSIEKTISILAEKGRAEHPVLDKLSLLELNYSMKQYKNEVNYIIDRGLVLKKFTNELHGFVEILHIRLLPLLDELAGVFEERFEKLKK